MIISLKDAKLKTRAASIQLDVKLDHPYFPLTESTCR